MTQDLPRMDGPEMVASITELEYAPGGSSEAHRHPGHTFVYVLEGALAAKIDDGPEKTYRPGEMFYEPTGALHSTSENAQLDQPAKILAFMVAPAGRPIVEPK